MLQVASVIIVHADKKQIGTKNGWIVRMRRSIICIICNTVIPLEVEDKLAH